MAHPGLLSSINTAVRGRLSGGLWFLTGYLTKTGVMVQFIYQGCGFKLILYIRVMVSINIQYDGVTQ